MSATNIREPRLPSDEDAGARRGRLAVLAFLPDWGHVQPLIRIAVAAQAAGLEVKCFVPAQAKPLIEQEGLAAEYFPQGSSPEVMETFRRLGGKSTFFREFSGHAHHNLLLVPETLRTIEPTLPGLAAQLKAFAPDVLATDAAVFPQLYGQIAQSLGVPLIKSHPSYGLAVLHRLYTQVYGLGHAHPLAMKAVETWGAAFRFFYYRLYYARHQKLWRELRKLKRAFQQKFDASFPPHPASAPVIDIMSAIGWIEMHFLRGPVELPEGFVTFPPRRLTPSTLDPALETWLDSSPDRVVYVSFGSMVSMDDRQRERLFRQLKDTGLRILWSAPKQECAHLNRLAGGDPAVRTDSYVAQTELLKRADIACFITHGGASSAIEAWAGGTPTICVPFFADQPYIGSLIEEMGTGFRAWKAEIGTPTFADKLGRVLSGALDQRVAQVSAEFARFAEASELQDFLTNLIARSARSRPEPHF